MIDSIKLKNFQSHKDSVLKFNNGVNIIIGTSDSGKSAILRGLRWVAQNKPSGEEYRSWWGGETEVSLIYGTSEISRVRGKSAKNEYAIYRNDAEPLILKAPGMEVPEPVANLINLSDINLQHQIDAPFLFSNTPGEVAKHFNKMANLNKIDASIKKAQQFVNSANSELKVIEKQIAENTAALLPYENLNSIKELIARIDTHYNAYTEKEISINELESSLSLLEEIENDLIPIKGIISAEPLLISISTLLSEKKLIVQQTNQLDDLVEALTDISISIANTRLYAQLDLSEVLSTIKVRKGLNSQIIALESLLEQIIGISIQSRRQSSLITIEDDVEATYGILKGITDIEKELVELHEVINRINSNIDAITVGTDFVKQQEKEFHANFPEICPLCGHITTKK